MGLWIRSHWPQLRLTARTGALLAWTGRARSREGRMPCTPSCGRRPALIGQPWRWRGRAKRGCFLATSTGPEMHPQSHTSVMGRPSTRASACGAARLPALALRPLLLRRVQAVEGLLEHLRAPSARVAHSTYPIQAMEGLPERPSANLLCCTIQLCRMSCSPGPSSAGSQACHGPCHLLPSPRVLRPRHLHLQSQAY